MLSLRFFVYLQRYVFHMLILLPQALASLRGLEGGDALLATEAAQSAEGSEAEIAGGRRRLSRRAQ